MYSASSVFLLFTSNLYILSLYILYMLEGHDVSDCCLAIWIISVPFIVSCFVLPWRTNKWTRKVSGRLLFRFSILTKTLQYAGQNKQYKMKFIVMFNAPRSVLIWRTTSNVFVLPFSGSPLKSTGTALVLDTKEDGISEIKNANVMEINVIVKHLLSWKKNMYCLAYIHLKNIEKFLNAYLVWTWMFNRNV